MGRKCTVPKLFGFREWFEERFGDLCAAHDDAYVNRSGSQIAADWVFAKGMWQRGYGWLAIPSFIVIASFGWLYWYDILGGE
jgi:hypothetical protein